MRTAQISAPVLSGEEPFGVAPKAKVESVGSSEFFVYE